MAMESAEMSDSVDKVSLFWKEKKHFEMLQKQNLSSSLFRVKESVAKETILPKYAWQQVTRLVAAAYVA